MRGKRGSVAFRALQDFASRMANIAKELQFSSIFPSAGALIPANVHKENVNQQRQDKKTRSMVHARKRALLHSACSVRCSGEIITPFRCCHLLVFGIPGIRTSPE
jgi:hypothetical protein